MRRLVVVVFALMVAVVCRAVWFEPRSLTIRTERQQMPGLKKPVRLLLVGDIQPAGPHETSARVRQIMEQLATIEVDAVVWVGDFVSERKLSTSFTPPEETAASIGLVQGELGSYAVLGNHDWYYDGERIEALLKDNNVTVLRDNNTALLIRGQSIRLIGLEDPVTHTPDYAAAFDGVEADEFTVVLSHTPDVFVDLPAHVDLTLAGHTHCGQVTIPFFGRPVVPSAFGDRFVGGWYGERGHRMFVTCGIGTAILPVRFLNAPEAVILELVPEKRVISAQ